MTAISALQNEDFILKIPKELINDKMVQKLVRLLEFRRLTKENDLTEKQASTLSEDLKEKWWQENKEWFLKDIEK